MKLILSKAFGIGYIPTDVWMWLLALEGIKCKVVLKGIDVLIARGQFGLAEDEQRVVGTFWGRPFDHELLTLDVQFDVGDSVPATIKSQAHLLGSADRVVEPYVNLAYSAVQTFLAAYRDCQYLKYRDEERWARGQVALPRMTEREFRTYLFYVLTADDGTRFLGSFSEGRTLIGEAIGTSDLGDRLQRTLEDGVSAERRFIQTAWQGLFDEDFAATVLYSAIAIERLMEQVLRTELTARRFATRRQISKVIDDTSNRVLCRTLLGVFGIGDQDLRERLADVFELRNQLAHGRRRSLGRQDAEKCLSVAEAFMRVAYGRAEVTDLKGERADECKTDT